MVEKLLVMVQQNPQVEPVLAIWGWQVAVYLFLGGLTAGIMVFSAWPFLTGAEEERPFAAYRYALWGPIVLSIGMVTLFLDLEYKLHVYRFYTTFQPSSPMSWGSWILAFVYPVNLLMILATLRQGYPGLARYLDRTALGTRLLDLTARYRRTIAIGNVPFAIALGIYTGILLSAIMARPFWNTALLGPLFLVSGLSTAAALAVLLTRVEAERVWFTRVDIMLIVVELAIVILLLIGLRTGAQVQIEAAEQVLGGPYTIAFWLFFVAFGLLVPLVLEARELRVGAGALILAPVLVLVGGFVLRQVTLDLGQSEGWVHHHNQYDAALLERLHESP